MVKKKTASFAEQLAELSNPAPSLDPEADVHSDTEAKLVDFDGDSSDDEAGGLQQPSHLRKLTSLPLSEGDTRYAGKTSSRNQWLADSDSEVDDADKDEESENQSSDEDDDDKEEDEDDKEGSSEEEEIDDTPGDQKDPAQDDSLMEHFKKIAAQMEEESESGDESAEDEEEYSKTGAGKRHLQQKTSDDDDKSEDDESEEGEMEKEGDEPDVNEDTDFSEEDASEEDASMKPFSVGSLEEELQRGRATKAQLGLWDSLLEARIKLQKVLSCTNQMPQDDTIEDFVEHGGDELEEALTKGKDDLLKLVSSMIELQETLLMKNPETRHVVDGSAPKTNKQSDDEEIPSDDEEIPSDDEEISSEDEVAINKAKIKQNGKERHNGSQGTKRKIEEDYFDEHLAKRHKDFEQYRNSAIQKWHDRTKLSSGKINSKSFSSFDKSPLAQIQQVLQDKARLIKRTQLKRTAFKILGKVEVEDKEEEQDEDVTLGHNAHLKDHDPEIFDDDDFYHQLLRELIEKKTTDTSDPVQLTRQWLEVQKLRSKVKKHVDTKASKGRKLRYDVHQKLVSFMPPVDDYNMADDARNELYGSLFGQRKFNHLEVAER